MNILRPHQLASGDVRPFAPVCKPLAVVSTEPDPSEALGEEIAALRAELANSRKTAEADAREARKAGFAEGKAAAEKDDAARTAALSEAAQSVVAAWASSLERTDELATRITHAALAKLFDNMPQASDFVSGALRRQLATLERDTIVAIQVSAADFPSPESLAVTAQAVGAVVTTDPALVAGACVIKLKLGELDIGLPTQWAALSSVLLSAAEEEAR